MVQILQYMMLNFFFLLLIIFLFFFFFFINTEESNLPLTFACKNNNYEIVQMLLESHSPTCTFDGNNIPLIICIKKNYIPLVFLLIRYGADPNFKGISTESPLDIAIENDSIEIIKLLISCGAETQLLNESILSLSIKDLLNEWIDKTLPFILEPNPNSDLDKSLKQLTEELNIQQNKIGEFLTDYSNVDFNTTFITPIINKKNIILINFIKFLKKIDYFGKILLQRRFLILNQQYQILSNFEKKNIEENLINDENNWSIIFNKFKNLIEEYPDSFSKDSNQNIDTLISQLPRKINDILPNQIEIDLEIRKSNRNLLLYFNQFLTLFKMLINETFRIYLSFSDLFIEILNKSINTLGEFRNSLLDVRQMTQDIIYDPKGLDEIKIEETCINQCDKIQIDISFLIWEKEKFINISNKIQKCLRHLV